MLYPKIDPSVSTVARFHPSTNKIKHDYLLASPPMELLMEPDTTLMFDPESILPLIISDKEETAEL